MNPPSEQKPPASIPAVNWDRVLKWCAIAITLVTVFGIISRRRSFLVAAELIDFLIVAGLLGLAAFALVAKSNQKSK